MTSASVDIATSIALERVGSTLQDKYKLLRLLGVGGMGAVYEAENTWTGRKVAIKLLQTTHGASPELVARFQQEARASTKIHHPNIIEVLDICREPDGTFFIICELLNGESLENKLQREHTLNTQWLVECILPVAGALATAHQNGIVHRDIKPDNLFLHHDMGGSLVPKVIDFGISKVSEVGASQAKTRTGTVMGTLDYLSPERARGEAETDHQSDIWSLGVVMFRALAGVLPFDASSANMVLIKIATENAPPLLTIAPTVHPALAAVVDRCLQTDRSKRYSTMMELIRDLLSWLEKHSVGAPRNFSDSIPRISMVQSAITQDSLAEDDTVAVVPGPTNMGWGGTKQTELSTQPPQSTNSTKKYIALFAIAGVLVVGTGLTMGIIRQQQLRNTAQPPAEVVAPHMTTNQTQVIVPPTTIVADASVALNTRVEQPAQRGTNGQRSATNAASANTQSPRIANGNANANVAPNANVNVNANANANTNANTPATTNTTGSRNTGHGGHRVLPQHGTYE